MMYNNVLKENLKKRPVFGMTSYTHCVELIEAMGYYGLDFVFIDAEHTIVGAENLEKCVMAARGAGIAPIVRITKPDEIQVRKYYEMGAEGIIVPHVKTKKDMEIINEGAKFPPLGRRGFDIHVRSAGRAAGFDFNPVAYIDHCNDTELVIPMCEDFEFIDNMEEILSVGNIDAVNFGPADFAMSLNIRRFYDMTITEVNEGYKKLVDRCRPAGINIMNYVYPFDGDLNPTDSVKKAVESGCNMPILGNDLDLFKSTVSNSKIKVIDKVLEAYK